MSKLSIKEECVGCHETENLTRCEGTMCEYCWSKENEVVEEIYA